MLQVVNRNVLAVALAAIRFVLSRYCDTDSDMAIDGWLGARNQVSIRPSLARQLLKGQLHLQDVFFHLTFAMLARRADAAGFEFRCVCRDEINK